MAAGEAAQTSFAFNTATPYASAIALAYRGVDTANPVNVAAFARRDGTTYTAPSVTTTVANTTLVALMQADDTVGAKWTAGGTMVLRGDTGIVAAFDEAFVGPGSTGTRSATSTAGSAGVNGLIALTPR